MKVCGLTGGVGMGKSTAASFLLQLGVRLIDTDDLARELVQRGMPAWEEIRNEFGPKIILADGNLNRNELAQIVFSNASARKKLEAILHPRIREKWLAQIQRWQAEQVALGFVVIPLLFETQAETFFEKIICIACSMGQQQERLHLRGWTPVQIKHRLAAQWSIEKKMNLAHCVVWTEGELKTTHEQLQRIVCRL